jgi:hypothetical protein
MDGMELLTDDERTYFGEFESMFHSEGWRLLLKELEAENEHLPEQKFWEAKDWDEIVLARVRLAMLVELRAYEDIVAARREDIMQQRRSQYEEYQAGQAANE